MHLGAVSAWGALLGVFIPSFAGVVYLVERELVLCWGGGLLLQGSDFFTNPLRVQLFPGASPTVWDLLPSSCLSGRRG